MVSPGNLLQWTALQPLPVALTVLGIPAVMLTWIGVLVVRALMHDTPTGEAVVATKTSFIAEVYAVLLGMLLVAAMSEFQGMQTVVLAEAQKLGAVKSLAEGLGTEDGRRLATAVDRYARAVVEQEWAELALGGQSDAADVALAGLWRQVGALGAAPSGMGMAASIQVGGLLRDVVDHRAERVTNGPPDAAEGELGEALLALTLVAIAVPWFMRSTNLLVHLLLAAVLTVTYVGMIVFAIDLFYPFAGSLHLGPEPFAAVLAMAPAS